MQLSVVSKTIGLLLMVFSLTQIPPLLIDFIYAEGEYLSFVISFVLTLIGGFSLWWPYRNIKKDFHLRDGVLIVSVFGWSCRYLELFLFFLLNQSIT